MVRGVCVAQEGPRPLPGSLACAWLGWAAPGRLVVCGLPPPGCPWSCPLGWVPEPCFQETCRVAASQLQGGWGEVVRAAPISGQPQTSHSVELWATDPPCSVQAGLRSSVPQAGEREEPRARVFCPLLPAGLGVGGSSHPPQTLAAPLPPQTPTTRRSSPRTR